VGDATVIGRLLRAALDALGAIAPGAGVAADATVHGPRKEVLSPELPGTALVFGELRLCALSEVHLDYLGDGALDKFSPSMRTLWTPL